MSQFHSKAIVLKKTKIGEKEFIYSLFSYDFGKIDVVKKVSKTEKTLDIGYDINFEIRVGKDTNIHKISHIKILGEFDTKGKDFQEIHEYLSLIQILYHKTEKNIPVYELYNVIHELLSRKVTRVNISLCQLKILHIFGELPGEHTDPTIKKILLFIHKNSIKNILRLSGVTEDIHKKLQMIYN